MTKWATKSPNSHMTISLYNNYEVNTNMFDSGYEGGGDIVKKNSQG